MRKDRELLRWAIVAFAVVVSLYVIMFMVVAYKENYKRAVNYCIESMGLSEEYCKYLAR
jgi:hypothetical protein